jgi:hypothetical protein
MSYMESQNQGYERGINYVPTLFVKKGLSGLKEMKEFMFVGLQELLGVEGLILGSVAALTTCGRAD